jgi:hypothetical protein
VAHRWVAIRLAALPLSLIGCVAMPQAGASFEDLALNGTFRATSNGDWAQTNDSYHDEQTVQSIWTITSACTDAYLCTGTVSSDQGWTAPVNKTSVTWTVDRDLPDWAPCADGTAAIGHQQFRFWRVDETAQLDTENQSLVYAGEDKATGPSGACGVSKALVIKMPFRLEKLS